MADYDDGYPTSDFDERALGPPPDSWWWPPGAVQVVMLPEDVEIMQELIAERKQQRAEARQAAMLKLFAPLPQPKPQGGMAEMLFAHMAAQQHK